MGNKLSMHIIEIDGSIYRVFDYKQTIEDEEPFYQNNAYVIKTQLRHMVLPFRGEMNDFSNLLLPDTLPGIYQHPKTKALEIRGPRTRAEKAKYDPKNVVNLLNQKDLSRYSENMFRDMQLEHKASGDIFMPEVHDDDDYTSKLLKTFISAKQISFGDYGARLERLSATKGDGSTGNARNNAKRALSNNRSMSASKTVYFATGFDGELALIIRDKPNCPNPALRPGEQMVIYPTSEPFKIENLVSVNDVASRVSAGNYDAEDDMDDTDFDGLDE